jgi:hypothetical protein
MKIPPRAMFMAQVSSTYVPLPHITLAKGNWSSSCFFFHWVSCIHIWFSNSLIIPIYGPCCFLWDDICFIQVVGTIISALVHLGTAWWLMETIPNICDRELLSPGSPWTCPSDHLFYDASVIWGLIGPRRVFGDLGHYSATNWFFLGGAIAPILVWLAHKAFPNKDWIGLISIPVLLSATLNMLPATAVNYTTWVVVGFASGFIAYRYYRDWWSRHNYVLSGALDAGLAFMAVFLYLCLGMWHVSLEWWGSESEGCPLASCPTAPGVFGKGCPIL